jgi:hypothetical protein
LGALIALFLLCLCMLALAALYVEQVDERKLVCVCVWCTEKLLCSQLVPGTTKQFLGLILTASRLLPPTKSVTQAKRQHVLFGRRLLAHIALPAGALYPLQ